MNCWEYGSSNDVLYGQACGCRPNPQASPSAGFLMESSTPEISLLLLEAGADVICTWSTTWVDENRKFWKIGVGFLHSSHLSCLCIRMCS